MPSSEQVRRIISLWQQFYDTADIAKLTGVPEAKVEAVIHRWREDKRKGRSLAAHILKTPAGPSIRPRQILFPTRQRHKIEDAIELARQWEADRPSRH